MKPGHKAIPFPVNRRVAAAAAAVAKGRPTIHAITEIDISEPRRIMREHKQQTGETLSLTAYVVACLARVVAENPEMNSFHKGRKLILLSDVTIGTFVEREIDGENAPEPIGIRAAQSKSYRQIHDEIRAAQRGRGGQYGSLSGMEWIRFIPFFLLRPFIRAASHSVSMIKRLSIVVGCARVGSDIRKRGQARLHRSCRCHRYGKPQRNHTATNRRNARRKRGDYLALIDRYMYMAF